MGKTNGNYLYVGKELEKVLRIGHQKTNEVCKQKLNKEVDFIDYTNGIAKKYPELFESPLVKDLKPIKKGRKSSRVEFDFENMF